MIEGRPLVLGGIGVPFDRGLVGHSDGDVLCHAVIDAIIGGAGVGDIGTYFPSSDRKLEGVDSTILVRKTITIIEKTRWRVAFVDATIIAEKPHMKPFVDSIEANLATILGIDQDDINIKSKATDGLGIFGRGEGIGAIAIATLMSI